MQHTIEITPGTGTIDPVCGMTVDPDRAAGSVEYQGKTYYFCSTHCVHRFRKDPEKFLNKTAPAVQPVGITRQPVGITREEKPVSGRKYTCPMHPEIVRDGPGSCPICGMALEPMTASLDDETNPELVDMTRRFWVAVVMCSRHRFATTTATCRFISKQRL